MKRKRNRTITTKSRIERKKPAITVPPREKPEDPNRISRRNRIATRLSVISLIAAALLITALFVFTMYSFGIITLPEFLVRLTGDGNGDAETASLSDNPHLNETLPETEYEASYLKLELTDEEIGGLLEETLPLDEYTLENTVKFYSSDGSATVCRNKVWKRGGLYRVERYDSAGTLVRRVVSDGSRVRVSEYRDGEVYSALYGVSAEFSMEHQSGMESVADMRRRIFGEDGGIENVSIALVRTESAAVYRVEFEYPSLKIAESADISLDYGLIMKSETRDIDGGLIYTLETESVVAGITGFDFNRVFDPDSDE